MIMFGQSASHSFWEGRLHLPIAALQFLLLEHSENIHYCASGCFLTTIIVQMDAS